MKRATTEPETRHLDPIPAAGFCESHLCLYEDLGPDVHLAPHACHLAALQLANAPPKVLASPTAGGQVARTVNKVLEDSGRAMRWQDVV